MSPTVALTLFPVTLSSLQCSLCQSLPFFTDTVILVLNECLFLLAGVYLYILSNLSLFHAFNNVV